MTTPAGIADRAWSRAIEYAHRMPAEIPDPECFADAYTVMIEDRINEFHYPDVADPTPEEFFYS